MTSDETELPEGLGAFPDDEKQPPAPVPAKAVKATKAPKAKRVAHALPDSEVLEDIDPRCPPRLVRQLSTGIVTGWSTIFRRNLADFVPHYRPGTDDHQQHLADKNKVAMLDALQNGGGTFDLQANV